MSRPLALQPPARSTPLPRLRLLVRPKREARRPKRAMEDLWLALAGSGDSGGARTSPKTKEAQQRVRATWQCHRAWQVHSTATVRGMPRNVDYTIAYESASGVFDLCKILFGGDGSYYLTAPYHPANRAVAGKITVNYAEQHGDVDLLESQELLVVDDEKKRLKVAHHPDGLLQFSGQGIRSGRDDEGNPRGLGTISWPLHAPTFGPSFHMGFSDPRLCGRPSKHRPRTLLLPEAEIEHMRAPGVVGLTLIGYFLPLPWREFVYRTPDKQWWINLLQPAAQAMKPLRVLLAPVDAYNPGLIGLEARPHTLEATADTPSFFVSTATGNLRRNANGDLLGDQLWCSYPESSFETINLESLNHSLPQPPYTAPPGTTDVNPDPNLGSALSPPSSESD